MHVTESSVRFEGRVFDVRVDRVVHPSGAELQLDVVVHPGSVTILPVDAQARIYLVEQYRHPAGRALLELPAGTLEPGEPPAECVRRECREEIGYQPEQLHQLGSCFLAPGYSTERTILFLATGLRPQSAQVDPDEQIRVVKLPAAELMELARQGQIHDAKTIVALHLAGAHGFLPGAIVS